MAGVHALFEAPAFQLPERSQPIRISRYAGNYWLSGIIADATELLFSPGAS